MNTIILTMNDTIASNDTIVVKLVKAAEACQPEVNGIITSWQDVAVALIVCLAIALIVMCGICKYYKEKDRKRQLEDQESKRKAEEEDGKCQLEEQKRKRKEELQNKKLAILKELCYDNKEKDPKMLIKPYSSEELKNYLKELDDAIKQIAL